MFNLFVFCEDLLFFGVESGLVLSLLFLHELLHNCVLRVEIFVRLVDLQRIGVLLLHLRKLLVHFLDLTLLNFIQLLLLHQLALEFFRNLVDLCLLRLAHFFKLSDETLVFVAELAQLLFGLSRVVNAVNLWRL